MGRLLCSMDMLVSTLLTCLHSSWVDIFGGFYDDACSSLSCSDLDVTDIVNTFVSSGENGQLRVGVRRASKQLPITRSTYFSSANLHLGVLAAASHAASEMIRFSVIYNPRLVQCMGDSWRVFFNAIAATTLQS